MEIRQRGGGAMVVIDRAEILERGPHRALRLLSFSARQKRLAQVEPAQARFLQQVRILEVVGETSKLGDRGDQSVTAEKQLGPGPRARAELVSHFETGENRRSLGEMHLGRLEILRPQVRTRQAVVQTAQRGEIFRGGFLSNAGFEDLPRFAVSAALERSLSARQHVAGIGG